MHLVYEETKNSKLSNEFKLQNLGLTGLIVYADLTFYWRDLSFVIVIPWVGRLYVKIIHEL